jgi:lysophospholipid acyltransferase
MMDTSPFAFIKTPESLQPFADQMYALPIYLNEALGFDLLDCIYFLGSLAAIACSLILKQIEGERNKKIFSMCTGMLIHFYVFGISALASVTQNLLTFAMMSLLPSRYQHIAVCGTSAVILALAQLHKQIYNPGVNGQDVPMNLMFNFCKVTSLVCCVSDGVRIKKEGRDKVDLKTREKVYANEDGIPNFFDFWAYMYFCGACISGPWYEFKDFQMYMQAQDIYKNIPSTIAPTLNRFSNTVVFIVINAILSANFKHEFFLTDVYRNMAILPKIVYT